MFYIFLAEGFEETEAIAPLDVMRRAGLEVRTVGVTGEQVTGSHGVTVKADISPEDVSLENIEGVVLPGGLPGTLNLKKSRLVLDCVKHCFENEKLVCAICAAPSVLGRLGILNGKKATCFPGFENKLKGAEYTADFVTADGNIITARGAGCAVEFGRAIVEKAISKQTADKVISDMQCR